MYKIYLGEVICIADPMLIGFQREAGNLVLKFPKSHVDVAKGNLAPLRPATKKLGRYIVHVMEKILKIPNSDFNNKHATLPMPS